MSEPSNEPIDINVVLNGTTVSGVWKVETKPGQSDKGAILIDFYGVEEWIPKSQCTVEPGDPITVHVEGWLAAKIEEKLGEVY